MAPWALRPSFARLGGLSPPLSSRTLAAAFALAWPGGAAAAPVPWCGNDVSAGDRYPDLVAGAQIHVDLRRAVGLGQPTAGSRARDRRATWLRSTPGGGAEDPTRAPRFDVFDFPGCDSDYRTAGHQLRSAAAGRRAPTTRSTITATSDAIYRDLRGSPTLNYQHPLKKYIVLYDGPTRGLEDACAVAFGEPVSTAFIYLQPPLDGCPPIDTGAGAFTAMVTAHELVHTLGGTGRTPTRPHVCNGGHVCDAEADIIYGVPLFRPLNERVLDAGHDDYYAHSQSWFDVQDSPFLVHVGAAQLHTVGRVDAGAASSRPTSRASMPDDMHGDVRRRHAGRASTRTPTPARPLSAWSGDCRGRTPCRMTMNANRRSKATFVTGTTTVPGTGSRNLRPVAQIASPGRYSFEARQKVTLTSKAYDRDGRIVSQTWDWGDGTRADGPARCLHVYARDGRYTVSLTVIDDRQAQCVRRIDASPFERRPPRALVLFALAQRGRPVDLRYIAFDNTGLDRVRLTLTRGK